MNFASIIYGLFLLSTIGLFWVVERVSVRLLILTVASLLFYASWQVQYVPLMVAALLMNYYLGRAIAASVASKADPSQLHLSNDEWQIVQENWQRQRLILLVTGIVINVLLLLGFKYVPFLLNTTGATLNQPSLQDWAIRIKESVVVPLGISFFSFECIAYLIDVYRGAPAATNLLGFSAYKLFFPKLISGPITRYHGLSNQFRKLQPPSLAQVTDGVWLIACGAMKKVLLADHLGILVKLSFDNLQRAGSGDIWLATFAYGLQLYLDFSGYVDMARGSALLLGLTLPENFRAPYFTTSIADFWRRWHITLGDWLRNYLYFPLGGSRRGLVRTCVNLMVVMLIAGIWHGSAWGFIIWGGLHGLALVIHRLTAGLGQRLPALNDWWDNWPGLWLGWLLTQTMVFFAWIFFRLPDLKDSGWAIQHLLGHTADAQFAQKVYVEAIGLDRLQLTLLLILLFVSMGILNLMRETFKVDLHWPVKLLLALPCFYLVWLIAPQGGLPYIYFDF